MLSRQGEGLRVSPSSDNECTHTVQKEKPTYNLLRVLRHSIRPGYTDKGKMSTPSTSSLSKVEVVPVCRVIVALPLFTWSFDTYIMKYLYTIGYLRTVTRRLSVNRLVSVKDTLSNIPLSGRQILCGDSTVRWGSGFIDSLYFLIFGLPKKLL